MRLYSDTLTSADLHNAARIVRGEHGQDIYIEDSHSANGRKRRHAIEFHAASFHGTRRQNRNDSREPAASWTAWGWLIAELFNRDPNAIIGQYKSPADFRAQCREAAAWRRRVSDLTGAEPRTEMGKDISFLKHCTARTRPKVKS